METDIFWQTEYTMPPGVPGFAHFCLGHLLWLGSTVVLCVCLGLAYRCWKEEKRLACRRILAVLLVADELFKYYIAIRSGEFHASFLPLHLCSINIFFIAADAFRPQKLLREVLYAVCLPGAFFALVFPGWSYLPLKNALCIHSFTAHVLLFLYPVLLIAGGFRPSFRRFARTLPAAMAVVAIIYGFNRVFGTNFMFLARAGEGNPLSWFESFLGSPGYLLGIPLIAALCWGVLYGLPRAWKNSLTFLHPGAIMQKINKL